MVLTSAIVATPKAGPDEPHTPQKLRLSIPVHRSDEPRSQTQYDQGLYARGFISILSLEQGDTNFCDTAVPRQNST
jgi:hypothetical protein